MKHLRLAIFALLIAFLSLSNVSCSFDNDLYSALSCKPGEKRVGATCKDGIWVQIPDKCIQDYIRASCNLFNPEYGQCGLVKVRGHRCSVALVERDFDVDCGECQPGWTCQSNNTCKKDP